MDSGGILFLTLIIGFVAVSLFFWVLEQWQKAKKYDELKPKLDNLDTYKASLDAREGKLVKHEGDIKKLVEEKTEGFPWLAQAYADYLHLQDMEEAKNLEWKSHPAPIAAKKVREIAGHRRVAEKLYRILRYQLEYYENLFPWLVDFKGEDIDDLIEQIVQGKQRAQEELPEPDDPAKKWLTAAEYSRLPTAEKYQLALDRYWQKKKSKWEIGRDYERYIGYLWELQGFNVYYQGIVEGFADLGRDLICTHDNNADIIQCKYWSKEKQIHEKHIFQLYGTVVAYRIDHPNREVTAYFITSTILSDRAKQFANELGIKIIEDYPLEHYPCIKCNLSRRDGTRIYHLPFDQQYDRTLVEEERNECYVELVKDAEALGYRKAFRWRGETSE